MKVNEVLEDRQQQWSYKGERENCRYQPSDVIKKEIARNIMECNNLVLLTCRVENIAEVPM